MILVDIEVPAFDKTYDFYVDESSYIADLAQKIGEMTAMSEWNVTDFQDETGMLLCSLDMGIVLEGNMTLEQYGIKSGSRLMLV